MRGPASIFRANLTPLSREAAAAACVDEIAAAAVDGAEGNMRAAVEGVLGAVLEGVCGEAALEARARWRRLARDERDKRAATFLEELALEEAAEVFARTAELERRAGNERLREQAVRDKRDKEPEWMKKMQRKRLEDAAGRYRKPTKDDEPIDGNYLASILGSPASPSARLFDGVHRRQVPEHFTIAFY
jgi:hypothetical protein